MKIYKLKTFGNGVAGLFTSLPEGIEPKPAPDGTIWIRWAVRKTCTAGPHNAAPAPAVVQYLARKVKFVGMADVTTISLQQTRKAIIKLGLTGHLQEYVVPLEIILQKADLYDEDNHKRKITTEPFDAPQAGQIWEELIDINRPEQEMEVVDTSELDETPNDPYETNPNYGEETAPDIETWKQRMKDYNETLRGGDSPNGPPTEEPTGDQ